MRNSLSMISPLVTTKISQLTLHPLLIFSLRTYSVAPLLAFTWRVYQSASPHHLPSLQKLILHWLQILIFHTPPLLRQQSKLAYSTSSPKCHLKNSMQVVERESERMKRKIEGSMKCEKRRVRRKSLTKRPVDVNKTKLHKASNRINSRNK
jgi:hypothetical protein